MNHLRTAAVAVLAFACATPAPPAETLSVSPAARAVPAPAPPPASDSDAGALTSQAEAARREAMVPFGKTPGPRLIQTRVDAATVIFEADIVFDDVQPLEVDGDRWMRRHLRFHITRVFKGGVQTGYLWAPCIPKDEDPKARLAELRVGDRVLLFGKSYQGEGVSDQISDLDGSIFYRDRTTDAAHRLSSADEYLVVKDGVELVPTLQAEQAASWATLTEAVADAVAISEVQNAVFLRGEVVP